MSAARAPHDPQDDQTASSDALSSVERPNTAHLRLPKKGVDRAAYSPARKMQSELAERLRQPDGVSGQKLLATLLVVCLSMSLATIILLTSH